MVSILVTVLKIVGISLLVILGLVIFILLLVLFVPVRYYGKGSYLDQKPCADLRASWLLHMISLRGEYQKGQSLHLYLKLFGIAVYDNLKVSDKKNKNKKTKSTKNKKEEHTGEIQAASSETMEETGFYGDTVMDKLPAQPGEDTNDKDHAEAVVITADNAANDDFHVEPAENNVKKVGVVQKIKIFFIKFVNFFKNIKFTFNTVCVTIVKIKDNIKYYLDMLQLDSTKKAFTTCQAQVVCVLRKISPRKFRVNLHLGFEDPAVMGEVLAVWGILYPIHQGNIDIQPEFEQSVMEGNFFFQGRVSVFVFVRAAWVLFFDKDVKQLLKQLKRSTA